MVRRNRVSRAAEAPPDRAVRTETLLAMLPGVRSTGRGRWLAQCPAHDDRSPSLSIRELDDGRILLNDFGGCAVRDVLLALRLDLSDLFPEPTGGYRGRRERAPFDARDVLLALADETQIAAIVAARIGQGREVDWPELDRLFTAVGRIAVAADTFRPRWSVRRAAGSTRHGAACLSGR